MGAIIVAGFAFIGWEVYQRATNPDHPRSFVRREAPAAAAVASPAATVTMSTGTAAAAPALPLGSRIGAMVEAGGRVVFHVTLPDGREELRILDPRSGSSQTAVSTASASASATVPTLAQPQAATP